MSALDPAELRYASISAFGLIIFTTLLKWTGVGNTRYQPAKLGTSNTTSLARKSVLDNFFDPTLSLGSNGLSTFIDGILTPAQFAVDLLLTWSSVWNTLGFTSIFIIVPMLVMTVIVLSFIINAAEAIIP